MAKAIRQPPGPADNKDPRAFEAFFQDLYDQHKMVGTLTYDISSLSAGTQTSFMIAVNGARPDKQQTVEVGLPSNWNTSLVVSSAFVSADDIVTIVIRNPTAGTIDMGEATYGVRVRP